MTNSLRTVEGTAFRLQPDSTPAGYVLHVSGTLDSACLPIVSQFLEDLHGAVIGSRGHDMTVDCRDLYFMNSSTVKCFVLWLVRVRNLSAEQRYRVVFRTNQRLAWQARTLGAICRAAPEIVSVT